MCTVTERGGVCYGKWVEAERLRKGVDVTMSE